MARVTCTRRIQFCAGHRVMGHENKCAHPHGHNYVALVEADAELDSIGRVIDFSVLKEQVGGWIERHWDHGWVFHKDDAASLAMLEAFGVDPVPKRYPMPYNPTAENMARYLLEAVGPKVLEGTGVRLVKVTVWETENCFATATVDSDSESTYPPVERFLNPSPNT